MFLEKKKSDQLALRCTHVSKKFSIKREKQLMRILFDLDHDENEQLIEALSDISLVVPRGKIVGILGRNGAGKSTLLRLLGQVYSPTSGKIDAFGQIAGLFELGGTGNPNLTGREYAIRYLRLMGVTAKDLTSVLQDIVEFSELGEAFDRRVRTYSSGMAARLYFAVATAYQHEIYLIDELLSVGDEHFQAKCWRRMRERLLNGASGVLVTHDWTAIVKLCENACVIENGAFSFVGPSDKAVVSYLKLPPLSALGAKFSDSLPTKFLLKSRDMARITLPVEILKKGVVQCAISVEMLRVGIGWEIVILSEFVQVGDTPGQYQVLFEIPDFPLTLGRYSLNLFLRHSESNGGDCRSWTYGNGLLLEVEGERSSAEVCLPYSVRRCEDVTL